METETKIVALHDNPNTGVFYLSMKDAPTMPLTGDELRAIVQQAYDRFGILAEPSLEREAERAPDLIATIRGHVDSARAQQEANRAGLCPCGANGCSDGVSA